MNTQFQCPSFCFLCLSSKIEDMDFFSDSMCMNRLNLLLEPDHRTPLAKSDSITLIKEKKKKKQESFRYQESMQV